MTEYIHNFMVVGLDHNSQMQEVSLQSIADSLYDKLTPTMHKLETANGDQLYDYAHSENSMGTDLENEAPLVYAKMRFIDVNTFLAKAGKVHSGQVLYIPPKDGGFIEKHKEEIQAELLDIDNTVADLPPKAQRLFAGGHHFLAAALTTLFDHGEAIGIGAHTAIDLSRGRLKLAKEKLVSRLKQMGAIAKKFNHSKNKGLKANYKKQFKTLLNELDGEVGYYLRVAGTANEDARIDFESETGAKWKRSVYDVKRMGVDQSSTKQMSRMILGTAKSAKRFALLGKIAIAVSVGESAVELGKVCHEHGFGKVCYATLGVESVGLGVGLGAGAVSEKIAEKWLTRGACNLLLDAETAGTGMVVCELIVNAGFGVTGAYVGMKGGKTLSKALISNIYPDIGGENE